MVHPFTCLSLSPMELSDPGLAVATAWAGGIGILDREFCPDDALEQANENLKRLLALVNNEQGVGLRLRAEQVPGSYPLLETLCDHSHWLILCQWDLTSLAEVIASFPSARSRKLLLEVTDIEPALHLNDPSFPIDGIVVKGHESGGWVGEDSTLILLQKLLTQQNRPVYAQGGIGIHTAAACRGAGAAGVVVDDQLLLMPESPLPEDWRQYLQSLSGQECLCLGERLNAPVRVLSRPGFAVITQMQQLAEQLERQTQPTQPWQTRVDALLGWGEPGRKAWTIGQAVGLAASMRDRYQTTGRFIQALLRASQEHLEISRHLGILQVGAPLAVAHRTTYPIVQGPMTRVSDTAEFAEAVAQAGALPLLALALMRGEQVQTLLQKTQDKLGDRAWGVGILGFVPQALRQEQLQVIKAVKPPFALIAGGRPDQAAQLEDVGIATYIHVPTPNLLQLFLEDGAKRFVFEGRECGGHIGPLSSFVLWESMIETLLNHSPAGTESDLSVLFAGGIHDARSAAMISVLAAPLAQRGIKVGVLMGSAYLFTQEAVSCGAILPGFQHQALTCQRTINLETGPGHASRCALTPFAQEFYQTRQRLLTAQASPETIKTTLEDLTLGRLRVATKGLVRTPAGITPVDEHQQLSDGMYMIGQVATLRDRVISLAELHQEVSQGSADWLAQPSTSVSMPSPEPSPSPSDIAIIGIGTLLPRAQHPEQFWDNILQNVDAITEIPAHRWDWRLYYDPDRQARDKTYSKWGGFLDDIPFDPLRFGIPPKSLKSIEPMQLLTLETVQRALADAGTMYTQGEFDRENTSVILGLSGGLADLGEQYVSRSQLPLIVDHPDANAWNRLPEWTEESFPGLLFNVTAGRVANRFDCGGANFTVDAACASSLAAVDLAVKELESGRCNLAIAGGVDTVQSVFAYMCFSKTQALSARGKVCTFDQSADGIVISEGIATIVLKRLADAQADGDRIYAVIKAVASSSDGKGFSMTAPSSSGQKRALNRAYAKAGFSPKTMGLYEAHGTGTVAGDRTELETISSLLRDYQVSRPSCVLGSVKTMLGHTKSAAGVIGLIKVALSLYHKVLPPHRNVENPLNSLTAEDSPLYLLKEPSPWLAHPDYPRRAGVSAFGFGGTNFHAVLEEYSGQVKDTALGANTWSHELFLWRASTQEALAQTLRSLLQALQNGAKPSLRDLAYSYAKQAQTQLNQPICLTLVVETLPKLQDALSLVLEHLADSNQPLPPTIQLGNQAHQQPGKLAFLFPGQGAQYPQMLREVALYFPEMRSALEYSDRQLQSCFPKHLSQFIYPPSAYSDAMEQAAKQQLTDTHLAQPALGTVEAGYLDLIARLDIKPDMVCGHSYGEYAGLHAAGVLSRSEFLRLSEIRGRVMAAACQASDGAMAAVQTTREELLKRLEGVEDVIIANHNAPLQSVISGKKQAVRKIVDRLQVADIMARMLPVAGAFHSSLVASAQTALTEAIATAQMESPQLPIYSNTTARPYDADVEAIRTQLSQHLLSPVEFVAQIEAMYAAGARIFLEVGPKRILSKLVNQILEGKAHTAVSVDNPGGGLRGLLISLGQLLTQGIPVNLTALFAGRDVRQLNLSQLVELTREPDLPPTAWLVNGGSARPKSEAIGYTGKLPPLNYDTVTVSANGGARRDVPLERLETEAEKLPDNQATPNPPQTTPDSNQPISPINASPAMKPQSTPVPPAKPSPDAALAAYQTYQQTMRQFLALQENVMRQFLGGTQSGGTTAANGAIAHSGETLNVGENKIDRTEPISQVTDNRFNGHDQVSTPKDQSSEPSPTAISVTPPNSMIPDRASLSQTLLSLVSDRTGYPPDMLGLDQDMEAELGIDSIKRIEIFGALLKQLPEAIAATLQKQTEQLTQVKTLNGLVDAILQQAINPSPSTVTPTHQEEDKERLGKSSIG